MNDTEKVQALFAKEEAQAEKHKDRLRNKYVKYCMRPLFTYYKSTPYINFLCISILGVVS